MEGRAGDYDSRFNSLQHQQFLTDIPALGGACTAMRHVLSAVVQNVPGVLAHISGMLASRGYNIDSLAVGETENPDLSRMTFVVVGDDNVLEQVRKQLEKVVTVVRVVDVSSQDFVERDLMLIKVQAPTGHRSEIRELAEIFRGRIVDVAARRSDRRNLGPGTQDRGVHRPDAARSASSSWCAPGGSPWSAASGARPRPRRSPRNKSPTSKPAP